MCKHSKSLPFIILSEQTHPRFPASLPSLEVRQNSISSDTEEVQTTQSSLGLTERRSLSFYSWFGLGCFGIEAPEWFLIAEPLLTAEAAQQCCGRWHWTSAGTREQENPRDRSQRLLDKELAKNKWLAHLPRDPSLAGNDSCPWKGARFGG